MYVKLNDESSCYDVQMLFAGINKLIEKPGYENAKEQIRSLYGIINDKENFVQIVKRIVSGNRNTIHREMMYEIVKTAYFIKQLQERELNYSKYLRERIIGEATDEEEPVKPSEVESWLLDRTRIDFDSFFSIILCIAVHESCFYETQISPMDISDWDALLRVTMCPAGPNYPIQNE